MIWPTYQRTNNVSRGQQRQWEAMATGSKQNFFIKRSFSAQLCHKSQISLSLFSLALFSLVSLPKSLHSSKMKYTSALLVVVLVMLFPLMVTGTRAWRGTWMAMPFRMSSVLSTQVSDVNGEVNGIIYLWWQCRF